MKRVVIFGGSGFIGKHLVNELSNDYDVVVVSRFRKSTTSEFNNRIKVVRLRKTNIDDLINEIDGSFAIINLSGESVGVRWTGRKMEKIRRSRLDVDSIIVRCIKSSNKAPEVVLLGSAIGIYGYSRIDKDITEETSVGKRGFLPKVALSHEESFRQLEKVSRVVYLRTGMVLGPDGGALPKIAMQFRFFVGGRLGNGRQWQSWIHIRDEINAIRFLMENESCNGAYNLTAPQPVQNKEFTRTLGKVLSRPAFLPAPGFILRLFLGKMANELLLKGLKVLPNRLINEGFVFGFSNLEKALNDIIKNNN